MQDLWHAPCARLFALCNAPHLPPSQLRFGFLTTKQLASLFLQVRNAICAAGALPPLVFLLAHASAETARLSAALLAQLLGAVADGSPAESRKQAMELGAVNHLKALLQHELPACREAAACALKKLGHGEPGEAPAEEGAPAPGAAAAPAAP